MKKSNRSGSVYVAGVLGVIVAIVGLAFSNSKRRVVTPIRTNSAVGDPAFIQSISYLLGPSLLTSNKVVSLLNGDQFFPRMLDTIRSAKKSVTLEMYIWESGNIGDQFKEALMERATNGVKVKLVLDRMGTLKLDDSDVEEMESAGVQLVKYKRQKWYRINLNLNHRTHRKILIVDGRVGFAGGACIADKWLGNAADLEHWRDNLYQIEGPAVGQLQAIFAENWLETTGEVLEGEDFFPKNEVAGNVHVQCFKSGPSNGQENARLLYLYSMAAARKSIRLAHAYFVPDDLCIQTLIEARKRGVEVEVIVPGKHDSAIGRAASRSRWPDLADAGVKFYQYKKALYHCKLMIVDDQWVSAGSVNFDSRSFRINDEANFNVWDREFAAKQIQIFEEDLTHSSELTAADLRNRPWHTKVLDKAAGLLRSQL